MTYTPPPGFIPPFMDLATLSAHISVSEHTIENWIRQGIFPPPRKNGGKRLWSWEKVSRHLAPPEDEGASSQDQLAERIRDATRRAAAERSSR